jgi:lipid-A-disaccharide synthase
MLDAAGRMIGRLPDLHFVVSVAPNIDREKVQHLVRAHSLPVDIIDDSPYDVMAVSELLLVASGTVTLEAAILNIPMVILYKVSALTYWIGRLMARVQHIGLVNLVAGDTVVPELIQGSASPERVAEEALSILRDRKRFSAMRSALVDVKEKLGVPGASERAAQLALGMMNRM